MKNVTTLEQLRETLKNAIKQAPVNELEIREFRESEEVVARMRANDVPENEIVKHACQVYAAGEYLFDVSTHRTANACAANFKKLVKALAILQAEEQKAEPETKEVATELGNKGYFVIDETDKAKRPALITAIVSAAVDVAPELVIKTTATGSEGIVFTFWHETNESAWEVLEIADEVARGLGYETRFHTAIAQSPRPHSAAFNSPNECLIRHGYEIELTDFAPARFGVQATRRRITSPAGVVVLELPRNGYDAAHAFCEAHGLMRAGA